MPLRVVHSVDTWLPRTQRWIHDQVRHLPEDVETHVVCETTEHTDDFPHPRIHSLRDRPLAAQILDRAARFIGLRHYLAHLRHQIERLRPEVVHSHFGHLAWRDLGAVPEQVRHVVTFYGLDLSRLPAAQPRWKRRYRELFRRADLFLCEGPHMAATARTLGCPPGKLRVHRLGVDLERIDFVPRRWAPGEPLRVLIAAAFREKKGIPYAIEALGRLRQTLPVEVTVVGDAVAQPGSDREKAKILDAVARSGLGDVRFPGFLPHDRLLDEAYRHHLFLSPSVTARDGDSEGGAPVALIEMAASGMPIVSTRHCDIPEVVLDGVNAALADERDVDGLVAGIRALADAHEAWPRRLREGRRHVEGRFDAVTQGRRLGELYKSLSDPVLQPDDASADEAG